MPFAENTRQWERHVQEQSLKSREGAKQEIEPRPEPDDTGPFAIHPKKRKKTQKNKKKPK